MVQVLYNNCYGVGFSFSNAFLAEYTKRTGMTLNLATLLFNKGPGSIRCDPVAITLFKEMGSAWCSGEGAALALFTVPTPLDRYWEIEETGGDEYVRIMISEALADILHTYMETKDHNALVDQYNIITGLKRESLTSQDDDYNFPYFT